ncbi:MAG: Gfo/Idh/MocA family oxidoreductase [Caldilineaceae bacterium]|nr:Gfo/Idh/MocA family oxidoreductase [Caldilineaceae bacterium]HRJ42459.1 Gfo/Idh/MocA family oxidoreductase [Caldilineaceae bacterium]
MPTYKAVIVGLTGIGARRASEPVGLPIYGAMPRSHAAAYHRHPQTEVVAVCDIRQEALDSFQREWADIWPDVRCYTDYRAMLAQEKPDLVSVCTPDHLHADITVDAANGGARAILCEKPIATTLADADRMLAAAETNNVLLSIEHTRRWSPIFLKARQMIRSGEYGPLRGITANLYSLRSMLFRNGTHLMDMICFFADADPAWVFAELEEGFAYFTEYKSDGGHDPKTDPAASAYIHFANGVRAYYNSLKISMPGSQFELVCDKARIEVSDRGVTVIQGSGHTEWVKSDLPVDDYMYTYQLAALAELIQVLEQGGDLISPAREARKTLEILLAMLKSHELGNVRVNLPLQP